MLGKPQVAHLDRFQMKPDSREELGKEFERWSRLLKQYPGVPRAVLALAAGGVFAGVLANGFVYDDGQQLLENPFVRNPHLWLRVFTGSVWSFLGAAWGANAYRPLHIFSYWLIYRLAGPVPAAYHLFQWLIYMATVLLVFELGRGLLRNEWAAFAGALLWSLQPLHVEAVAWIAAVPDMGCAYFYLLGFWLFLRAEKAPSGRGARHAGAALAYLPALFFKEMALSLPVLLLAYWYFFPPPDSWRRKAAHWLPYLAAAVAYMATRLAVVGRFFPAPHFWRGLPRAAIAAVGLLGQHTKLFFWPVNLNVFHTFDPIASLRSPWPWLTAGAILLALGFRRRQARLGFLVVWWVVTLGPCLDVRQLSFPLLAERFAYLPSVGLCLALAAGGFEVLPQHFPRLKLSALVAPALAMVVSLWTVLDLRALPHWRNNDVLWEYSLRAAPDAGLVHVHRALVLQFRDHDLGGAAREYATALRLNRASFLPFNNVTYDSLIGLGQIADAQGQQEEALDYYHQAVRTSPGRGLAFEVLGSFYFPRGDYSAAAAYFQRAVEVNPQDLGARFYLGTCWVKLGQPRQAAEQFRAAREVDPSFYQAFEAEARALEAAGLYAEAARVRSLAPGRSH